MKLFLWYYLDHVSSRFHEQGGLVVIADSLDRAKEIAIEKDCHIRIDCPPDKVFTLLEAAEEEVIVFPDAGCC